MGVGLGVEPLFPTRPPTAALKAATRLAEAVQEDTDATSAPVRDAAQDLCPRIIQILMFSSSCVSSWSTTSQTPEQTILLLGNKATLFTRL